MLEKIKNLSQSAQDTIKSQLENMEKDTEEYQDLVLIDEAYAKISALIVFTQSKAPVFGAWILSGQLSHSKQQLNAAELLSNYLTVLSYPTETTFKMKNKKPSLRDDAKAISLVLFAATFVSFACFPPALFMGFMPALLFIFALPLLITYACDEPFSMARFYQEMAGIQEVLAYALFGAAILALLLSITVTPAVPLSFAARILFSPLAIGVVCWLHSGHLQTNYDIFQSDLDDARKWSCGEPTLEIGKVYNNDMLRRETRTNLPWNFFKKGKEDSIPQHISNLKNTLSGLTA